MTAVRKSLLICFLLTAFCFQLAAQHFYVTTGPSLMKIDFNSTGGCVSTDVTSCIGVSLSIAFHHDTLYYNRANELYRAVLQGKAFTGCSFIDTIPASANSLTVDSAGIIYFAVANRLYKKDPRVGGSIFLGAMPYSSAGDMVFYNHNLYMASTEGVVEVNIAAPAQSTLIIPDNSKRMYGLATLAIDCNKNGVYAFINRGTATDLVELDIANKHVAGTFCSLPYGVNDAASLVEDGSFASIAIDKMIVKADCDNPGKGNLQIVCEAGLVPYTYTLNNSIQNATGGFQNLPAGNYAVKITTPGGCEKDTTVTIPSFDWQPTSFLLFTEEPTCAKGGKVWFSSQSTSTAYSVVYNKDSFLLSHVFTDLLFGDHHFTFMNAYGCVLDSATVSFVQKDNCDTIYFPNAFTPNGDGKNDVFKGSYNFGVKQFKLSIYNRWGQLVFATTDQHKGWNGSVNGMPQGSAVFVWLATYITNSGRQKVQKGTVALIR